MSGIGDALHPVPSQLAQFQEVMAMRSSLVGEDGKSIVSSNIHTGNAELRVFQENHICVDNTTAIPLLANATFTGGWQDCLQYQEVNVSVVADKDSATNGLVFQWSADGTNIGDTDTYSYYTAGGGTNYTPNPAFRYFRIVYTNSAQAQGTFSLQTILRRTMTGGSFHRIDSTLKDDADARLNITIPKLKTAQNTYVSQTATTAGNAKMSIQEFDEAISTDNKLDILAYSYNPKTGTYLPIRQDGATNALQIIDYGHHEVHSGSDFYYHDNLSLGLNGVQDYIITTPNTTKWPHFAYDVEAAGAFTVEMYEEADRNGTTLQTMFNRDRNSLTTNTTTIHKGQTGGTTDGTRIIWKILGAGKTTTLSGSISERILKQNTKYIFRITSNAAGNVIFINLGWYEHTNV